MKPLTIILAILLIGCIPPDVELTTVSAAYAPFSPYHEVNRMEIDVNGHTYKVIAHNTNGGVQSEPLILPSGTVTRLVFYYGMKPVYEVVEKSDDDRVVCFVPFSWLGGEQLSSQVFSVDY